MIHNSGSPTIIHQEQAQRFQRPVLGKGKAHAKLVEYCHEVMNRNSISATHTYSLSNNAPTTAAPRRQPTMPTHKPHLHADPLTPEVIAIIEQLQSWLLEAEYEEFVQGFVGRERRHGVCVSIDRFEKLVPITDTMKLDVQVRKHK